MKIDDRMDDLEKPQNSLMNRLNKVDIGVTGLPKAVPNIISKITKIAKICEVFLNENDLSQCTQIKNKEGGVEHF